MARDARWVRLYRDDSPEWASLGWSGRSLVFHVLQALDTTGHVFVGPTEPWRLAVELFGAPEAEARRTMAHALSLGVVKHVGCYLTVPGFVQGRGAASDAERKRRSRRRQRDRALSEVTKRDMSQNVTPTNGYHAIAAENVAVTDNVTGHVTRDIVTATLGSRLVEAPYEDDPSQIALPTPPPWHQLLKLWEQVAFNGLPSGDPHAHKGRLQMLWEACKARDAANPQAVFRRAAEGYCEAQRKRGRRPGLRWFAEDFEQYADTYKKNGKRTSPLIEELEATKALRERAAKAGDSESAARLDLELARIGKQITDSVLGGK